MKDEFGFFQELDEIYQETLHAHSVNTDVQFMVRTMYLQAHGEFYVGMSQFLRSHLSKSFLSLRIAIDAGFNADYFIKNPNDIREFIDEKSRKQKEVFWRIKNVMDKNPLVYPLAQRLIELHELASNYAAHASIQSIIHKYKYEADEKQKKEEAQITYFDGLELSDFMGYYFSLLKGYFMVFQLFYEAFFKQEFKGSYLEREKRIAGFETNINQKGKQYPLSRIRDKKA